MSEKRRPIELAARSEIEFVDFETIFNRLADGMRQYDRLTRELGGIKVARDEQEISLDKLVLIDQPPDQQSKKVAVDALGHYILNRRAKRADETISKIYGELSDIAYYGVRSNFRGQKVKVAALNDRYELSAWIENDAGYSTFAGRKQSLNGKLVDFQLDPRFGGLITVRSRWGTNYRADPLIDRDNDYQPAFSIEIF